MKVPFVYGPDDLRLCEIQVPHAGPRDVVIRMGVAGICGSDLGYVARGGTMGPTGQPMPLGHELAGTVSEAGAEVTSVTVGARVIVNPLINLIGNGSQEGGFAELLLVRDVAGKPGSLLLLPDTLSMDIGALVEPLAVAAHAIKKLAARPGDKVAVFGAGPIGLACVVVLCKLGIKDVVVFDFSAFRCERAKQLGAREALDPRTHPAEEALKALHGTVPTFRAERPQTSHFIEASGAPLLPDIIGFARLRATICVVSLQKKPVPVDFMSVMTKELSLIGAFGYPTELGEVLDMLQDGTTDLEPLISHRFDGDDFMAAFDMAKQPDCAAKVLVHYNA